MTRCRSAAYALLHRKRFGKTKLWVGVISMTMPSHVLRRVFVYKDFTQ